ncbi:hypothetical protein [Runella zeae]|uniref:hypothetical protein n=1 Tax=Runella zeae TaxID=94255 RepID=UPI0003FE4ED5|nr:hypothetical protein [Runella zeae]
MFSTTIKSGASDKSYFGGKGQDGVYQTIINEIPKCHDYWEIFAGNASIFRRLTNKAKRSFLIESNHKQAKRLAHSLQLPLISLDYLVVYVLPIEEEGAWVVWGSAFQILTKRTEGYLPDTIGTYIFVDPPYPLSTRSSNNRYLHELTDGQHELLLTKLLQFENAQIGITTYPNAMYEERLTDWRKTIYSSVTRSGQVRTEHMYLNYEPPQKLQDTYYIGKDYRERETLKKQQKNWAKNFAQMHKHQRQAIIEKLIKLL